MKPRILSVARLSLAFASAIAALMASQAVHAQQYWRIDGTGAVINTANWSASPTGPFTSAFTANGNIVFGATSAITGATVNIGNITVVDGATVTFTAGGTLGTNGAVRTLDVGTGSTLNLGSQAISTTAGTGFIKNGAGILTLAGGTYAGGFTLNAGTVAVAGVNAMGAGGVLTINGGTIRSNGTTARDLTGKYTGGITIGGNFALGDGTNNGALTFTNNTNLGASSRTITVNSAVTWGGIISGSTGVGITKSGAGTLTLSGANSYSGNTTLGGGIIALGNNSALGSGALSFSGTGVRLVVNDGVSITNNITIGTNSAGSGRGMIENSGNGNATIGGTITINNGAVAGGHFASAGTGTLTVNSVINSASTAVTSRLGTVIFGGVGSSYANFTIGAGTVRLGANNGLATNATVDVAASGAGNLDLAGFNQSLVGITRITTNAAIIGNSSTAADSTLTTTGTSTYGGIIQNTLGSGTRTVALTVNGGNLTLSGDNSYTGGTLVSAGTLTLSGTGDINGSSGITVNGSGAKFLQTSSVASTPGITLTQGTLTGNGTVGAVNAADSVNAIITNNNGVAGAALTVGSLNLAGAANLNLFSNSFSSNLIVTGTLTTAATPATLTANNAGGWINGTPYDILTFGGGSIAGSGDNFTKVINNLATRQSGTWNTTSTAITLTLSGDNPVWCGANGGTWTTEATNSPTSGTPNWALKTGLTATDFWVGDIAEFNDTYDIGGGAVAPTTTTVDISTAHVSPSNTTFNNSAVNYTLNSSGGFGIATGNLTKNGTGTLTINTNNSYTGATAINGGTLTLSGSIGGTAVSTANSGTQFIVTSTNGLTGTSSLAVGAGTTAVLSAANNFSGATSVAATGTLQLGHATSMGSSTMTLASGATLQLRNDANTTFTAPIATPGAGVGVTYNVDVNQATGAGTGRTLTLGNMTFANATTNQVNVTGGNGYTLALGTLSAPSSSGSLHPFTVNATTAAVTIAKFSTGSFGSALTLQGGNTINLTNFEQGSNGTNSITVSGTGTVATLGSTTQTNNRTGGSTSYTLNSGTLNLTTATSLANVRNSGTANAATFAINGGTLNNTSGAALTLAANSGVTAGSPNMTINGDFAFTGNNDLNLGAGTVSLGTSAGTSRTITVNASTLTLGGIISDGTTANRIIKDGAGTLTLSGANTYSGGTDVSAGTLKLGAANVLPDGTGKGNVSLTGTLDLNSFSETINGLSGAGTVDNSVAGTPTLTVGGNDQTSTFSGTITNTAGTLALAKTGTGTLTLSGLSDTATSNYAGATTLGGGSLAITHATTAALTGGLIFGSAAANGTVSTLDLSGASATFTGAALVQTNNTNANTITIGAGETLTLNGGLTLGYAASSGTATDTKLTATGGTMAVNGTNLIVGISGTGTANSAWFNRAVLDVSGLANFTTNVTNLRVGAGDNIVPTGNLLLSNTANTIQATTLTIGDTGGDNGKGTSTLTLGTGTNVLWANTIEIGKGKNSGPGVVTFVSQTPSAGTVAIANKAGTGPANITIANNNGVATGGGSIGTLDLRGHEATVNAGTLLVGRTNAASSNSGTNGTVHFDDGDFTVATLLELGQKTGNSTGTATGTLNVGGGTFTVNTQFKLGSQTGLGGSAATLNITGGTFTSNTSIAGGAGNTNSTITLNGASAILDMTGDNITDVDTITYTDGTIKNLGVVNTGMTLAGTGSRVFDQGTGVNGEIQGAVTGTGIGLTKQGDGKLTLSGTNTYDGATLVSAGTLLVTGSLTSDVTVSDTATVGGGGTVGNISFGGGSFLDIALAVGGTPDSLTTGAISFAAAGFGIDNLVFNGAAVDWSTVANGTYTLLTGTLDLLTLSNLGNLGLANAYDIDAGGPRSAYFESGSLNLVVIPEPNVAALIGAFGGILLFRRRR